jgi:peptidoglycan/xylan/chitin deacetylase (PgdA/CDA1 family)
MKKKQLILLIFTLLLLVSASASYVVFEKHLDTSNQFETQPAQRPPIAASMATPLSATTSISSADTTEIAHGDTTKKQVIFTFDGGGTIQSANTILQVLAKHHVKGTFFLTGKMVQANPDLVRRVASAGHEIFSHTFDHPDLTTLTDDQITQELNIMEGILKTTANVSPKPYFRAPYGARNARVLAVAAKDGYRSVYWTLDALDWKEPQGETAQQVKERILSHVAPGNIYLMHVGDSITGSILDDVFTTIESKGYRIVSLTQGI